jgi:hypothetical protein
MRISVNKRQFACAGVEGETFRHLVNASKQKNSKGCRESANG